MNVRIGIHSGPAYVGYVGGMQQRYSLFGDTVNVAKRMETNGAPMKIAMSDVVWSSVVKNAREGEFDAECMGDREVKGRGAIRMWLLDPKIKPVGG